MYYAVTLICAVLFTAWMMYKGKHWHDKGWEEAEWPVAETV